MKTHKLILPVLLAGFILMTNCKRKDDIDHLSSSDQEYFEEMNQAYEQAKVYNDSLIYIQDEAKQGEFSSEYREYCDSLFHHHENEWNHHHDQYSHDKKYCDHSHDGGMMHGRKSRHQNHDYTQSHHQHHHDEMHDLSESHNPYHP